MESYQANNNKNIYEDSHTREENYIKNRVENKFAKRARSIKDNIISRFPSMGSTFKTPCTTQKTPDSKVNATKTFDEGNLASCFKQVTYSLRHILDVISKNALQMLPDNATIVLEDVLSIHNLVTSHDLNRQSSIVHSTLNQVYQSVANLIKFCDDYFFYNEQADDINEELAKECVVKLEQAVINLVSLLEHNNQHLVNSVNSSGGGKFRSSLPEITTNSSEMDTLASDSSENLDNSFCLNKSWESISFSNPPSKPSFDRNLDYRPPLPPKMKYANVESSNRAYSMERLSFSSQGEYDSSSLQDYSIHHDTWDDIHSPHLQTQSSQYISYSSSISSSSQHIMCNSHHIFNQYESSSSSSTVGGTAVMLEPPGSSRPPLPNKQNARRRHDSHYDNVPDPSSIPDYCADPDDDTPPPLPPKKKHIMAYMEMFGQCHEASLSCHSDAHLSCQSYHAYSHAASVVYHVSTDIQHASVSKWIHDASKSSIDSSFGRNLVDSESDRPALPPKKHNPSPHKAHTYSNYVIPLQKFPNKNKQENFQENYSHTNNNEDHKTNSENFPEIFDSVSLKECSIDFIEELDVRIHLIFTEDQQDVRGAHPDALLVHATRDNNVNLYQDAFLTTYRTFKTPLEIIEKLIDRYNKFSSSSEGQKQRAKNETFSFLVRVVTELTIYEFENNLLKYLTDFIHQLLSCGYFSPAKTLRSKLLKKYIFRDKEPLISELLLSSLNVYTRQYTLLDFKSESIAEQMTLLDSELFVKIEIPEVLAWIEQQNEEKSPNLTKFTEHFNKVSYWARTRILEQNEARDREKYVVKFIKIMKHLRKMNNFNGYLGLLSALDSAPIRRLEWQKYITEGLKEYCALIDSTSSFRAYRQALAETQPPCIPYIGLVLQDLTFVHIGNPHLLPSNELPSHIQYKNVINFSKRRQQFNIVQNMKRFRTEVHTFQRQDKIIEFFGDFENYLSEEAMWQMSETIKPRGKPKH